MNSARADLHQLIDALDEQDLPVVRPLLQRLVVLRQEEQSLEQLSPREEVAIREGLEDFKAGRVLTAEQAFAQWRKTAP